MIARELRIGNWVLVTSHTGEVKKARIVSIWPSGVTTHLDENYAVHIGSLSPMPLSVEILLEIGFIKTGKNKYSLGEFYIEVYTYDIGHNVFTEGLTVYDLFIQHPENGFSIMIKAGLKYFHELQNLYFALADEEL